ncbi:MAG: hypothetical protein ACJ0TD_10895 [Arenicellales bacterium]
MIFPVGKSACGSVRGREDFPEGVQLYEPSLSADLEQLARDLAGITAHDGNRRRLRVCAGFR